MRHGATVVATTPAVFRVAGPGALACLQGLLTNDLEKPGDGSLVYGALLTPKGMIVVDAWVLRQGDTFTLIVPPSGRAAAARAVHPPAPAPPRPRDRPDAARPPSPGSSAAHGFQVLAKSGVGTSGGGGAGGVGRRGAEPGVGGAGPGVGAVRGPGGGPHAGGRAAGRRGSWAPARAPGDESDLHAARLLSGWPALGVEIDERTLPQEVRYDEIGGVSYTKGCYTGQETVARLHFRGHTNRELRGLRWPDAPSRSTAASVVHGEKDVGSVRSTLTLEDRVLGLGLLRREVGPGETVVAGGRRATVVALPFGADEVDG